MATSVKVSNRYQIAVPQSARKKLNIQKGDRLLVDVQDGVIVLVPQPKRYSEHLAGLHKAVWENVDAQEYIDGERNSMGGLREKLASAGVVGLDTSIFIYQLEANPTYATLTKTVFENLEAGKFQGVTSTITLMELTVLPWRMGHENIAREYEALLVNFPNLSIVDIDRNVARLAAKLRADFNVSPADALQVAASLASWRKGVPDQ